jgi:SsrA-binding protein
MSLIQNKKATFNYEVQDKYEAGIELLGFEVKSIQNKLGKLDGSYISIRGGEAFLIGSEIPAYQPPNTPTDYEPSRVRKLLLTKKELLKLADLEKQNNLTLVPISLYNKGRKIKLEFAVARGKKKSDKRSTIQKREADREIERTLKSQR